MNKPLQRPGLIFVWLTNIIFIIWTACIVAAMIPEFTSTATDAGIGIAIMFIFYIVLPFWFLSIFNFAYITQAISKGRTRMVLRCFFGFFVFAPFIYLLLGLGYNLISSFL